MAPRGGEKRATNSAAAAAPASPKPIASHRLGGLKRRSAAAAPYIPRPKNAEWPNDTMPVYPIKRSDDIASNPQISTSVRKRRQNTGSTSGATISKAITTQKPIQKMALWLSLGFAIDVGFSSGAVVILVSV